jgi:membrane associated rhomboid family serine protease
MNPNQYLYSGKRLFLSVLTTSIMILLMWGVQGYVVLVSEAPLRFGLRPWSYEGFLGVATMPFLHGGFDHLISNTIPFFVLGSGLFYYYREAAWKVLLWILILTGLGLWFIGKPGSNHIGASGVVYGLVGFHLLGGVIRKNRSLMAYALLVVFLYGGFIWSLFPEFFPDKNISWEGHLAGLVSGLMMALACRSCGPENDPAPTDDDGYDTDDEIDEISDDGADSDPISTTLSGQPPVRYHVT